MDISEYEVTQEEINKVKHKALKIAIATISDIYHNNKDNETVYYSDIHTLNDCLDIVNHYDKNILTK